jgi:hypothetical protein
MDWLLAVLLYFYKQYRLNISVGDEATSSR